MVYGFFLLQIHLSVHQTCSLNLFKFVITIAKIIRWHFTVFTQSIVRIIRLDMTRREPRICLSFLCSENCYAHVARAPLRMSVSRRPRSVVTMLTMFRVDLKWTRKFLLTDLPGQLGEHNQSGIKSDLFNNSSNQQSKSWMRCTIRPPESNTDRGLVFNFLYWKSCSHVASAHLCVCVFGRTIAHPVRCIRTVTVVLWFVRLTGLFILVYLIGESQGSNLVPVAGVYPNK